MRIAIFSDIFSPMINGVVTHILSTTNQLSQNNQIMIFAPKPKDEQIIKSSALPKSVRIEYLTSLPAFIYEDARVGLPFLPVLFSKIRQFNPDIIHFHSPLTVGLNGIMAAKILKKPLIGTFHTYFMEPEYLRIAGFDKLKLDENQLINSLLWKYSNFYYNQADVVICPSLTTKKDLIEHGITQPIQVVSNGVATIDKLRPQFKLELPKHKYFLYIGRISVEKNLDILIKAFQIFSQKNNVVDLVIAGDGPIKSELHNFVKELQLDQRIHFLGQIENHKLLCSNIYNEALAFITTSKSETQCISVLEAMNHGLPIIGVNSRALPELIKDNGIICQPDDVKNIAQALILISQNIKKRNDFSKKSLSLIKNHSLQKTVTELEKIYQKLITSVVN